MITLISSMPSIFHYRLMAKKTKKYFRYRISKNLKGDIERIEEEICKENNWKLSEYFEEINRRVELNDQEIITILQTTNNLINKASSGKKIVVNFEVSPELTKENTLLIYKWTILFNNYWKYINVHGINPRSICSSSNDVLLKQFKITTLPHENFSLALQRAYYTYCTNDKEFDNKAKEIINLKKTLDYLINTSIEIPEYSKDPFEMTETELNKLYNDLCKTYNNPQQYFNGNKNVFKKNLHEENELQSESSIP